MALEYTPALSMQNFSDGISIAVSYLRAIQPVPAANPMKAVRRSQLVVSAGTDPGWQRLSSTPIRRHEPPDTLDGQESGATQ